MPEIFLASDTHFGHHKILEFESMHRPFDTIEQHDEVLIDRWNKTVGPNDIVWHLGDIAFNKRHPDVLAELNGKMDTLILGNHDWKHVSKYLQYFTNVYAMKQKYDMIFTHIPIHASQMEYRWEYNVHGHIHGYTIDDKRYINISYEHTNLTPISMTEVREIAKERTLQLS